MSERPILFSAPMVRAILAGTKTQTRRAIKAARPEWIRLNPQPHPDADGRLCFGWDGNVGDAMRCPYGQPGDRLWVRETFGHFERNDTLKPGATIYYRADGECLELQPWRPSIHMPRWASRITLEITGVRVERLQDISEADSIAEGIEERQVSENDSRWVNYLRPDAGKAAGTCGDPRDSYRTLWEAINGPGSWGANPWVWCIEFRRLEAGNV